MTQQENFRLSLRQQWTYYASRGAREICSEENEHLSVLLPFSNTLQPRTKWTTFYRFAGTPRVLLLENIFEGHEYQVRSSISLNTTQWGLPPGFPSTSSIKISAGRGVRVHPLTAADTYSSLSVVHGCTKRNSDKVQTGTGMTRRHIPFSVWTMASA